MKRSPSGHLGTRLWGFARARALICLVPLLVAGCAATEPIDETASGDYYGLNVGLVRTYRTRFPLCGNPCDSIMRKTVVAQVPCPGGTGALVAVEVPQSMELHAIASRSFELFAETESGFGYCGFKGDAPKEIDPKAVQLELMKPLRVGAEWQHPASGTVMRLEAFEEVSVKAGTFGRCARVRFLYKDQSWMTFWFAPKVGMVKGVSSAPGKDHRPAVEYELLSVDTAINIGK